MTSRLFQTIIYQMQSSFNGRKVGVMTEDGNIIACSDINFIGEIWTNRFEVVVGNESETVVADGYTMKRISGRTRGEYIVFCEGNDELASTCVGILCVSLFQIKQYYDEKYDKISFIKNILSDNIMAGDIHMKSHALYFNAEVYRVAFVIHTEVEEVSTHDIIQSIFPDENKDFVVTMSETDVVLIKEVKEDTHPKELFKIATQIRDTISTEAMASVRIGIGSVVANVVELNRSYKDACVALEVGRVFENERDIVSYNNLGIGRLIYQLPTKLCELFLDEVFKKGTIDLLDDETIVTIQKFFENNLNVSEASRQLFVHRNTLVYRLDKIYKLTGLDLRHFDDAIIFKVAMMVNKYLNSDTMDI